jgi:hypothetical protein
MIFYLLIDIYWTYNSQQKPPPFDTRWLYQMMKFTVLDFHKDTIDSLKSSKHGQEWEIIVGFKLHKIQYVKITLVWNRMRNYYFSHILGDFLAGLSYTQLALRVGPNGMSFVLWMQNPLHI